jgi:hypothetical protein
MLDRAVAQWPLHERNFGLHVLISVSLEPAVALCSLSGCRLSVPNGYVLLWVFTALKILVAVKL